MRSGVNIVISHARIIGAEVIQITNWLKRPPMRVVAVFLGISLAFTFYVPETGHIHEFSGPMLTATQSNISWEPFAAARTNLGRTVSEGKENNLRISLVRSRIPLAPEHAGAVVGPHPLFCLLDDYIQSYDKGVQQSFFLIDLPPPSL